MLIRFNVTNFLSFDRETEFNMLAATSLKTHKEHIYPIKAGVDVLKSSAIYGANGAGKSNLIIAIEALKNIVEEGKLTNANFDESKFRLNTRNKDLPTIFEIEFSVDKNVYTYGIGFSDNIILEEWFFKTGSPTPKLIFERKYSKEKKHSVIKMPDKYLKSDKTKMLISLMEENLLKSNELLISKNENLKIKEIEDLNWIKNRLSVIYPDSKNKHLVGRITDSEKFKIFSEELLKAFDVGITNFKLKTQSLESFLSEAPILDSDEVIELKQFLDNGQKAQFNIVDAIAFKKDDNYYVKKLFTNHSLNGNEYTFQLDEESDGTQRLIDFIPMWSALLKDEVTFIVDEIDRSLHPYILHKLIKKIMNDNTTKGQLIFTTHESSLLNCKIFRPDEIWFVEKDLDTQSTQLYTLNDFKPRYDLDIEKGYLNGRFGAIPFLSKLEDLNWNGNGL